MTRAEQFSPLLAAERGETADQVQAILRAARRYLAMDVSFISEFIQGNRIFRFTDAERSDNPIKVGASNPLEESYCHYVARGSMPGLMKDARDNVIAAKLPVTHALPVGAHLSVPLRHSDGTAFGTLCCFSFAPDQSLTKRHLGVLRMCADVVCAILEKDRRVTSAIEERRAMIGGIIAAGAIGMVFQPIFRVEDGRLSGFEALARFPQEPVRSPDKWFADADEVGLGLDLEFLAAEKALSALPHLDPSLKLTVNLSPAAIVSPRFGRALVDAPVNRVVIELTEHATVGDYEPLHRALAPLRKAGLRLAIDDVGAGHSTFRHILDLAPELIKLDRSLITDIHRDTARRALAEALTTYARRIGCEVVAEGVETRDEFSVLREIGITRVQGYYLGRPMPLRQAADHPARWAVED